MNADTPYFSRAQAEAFAAGLVAMAQIDGRTPQESRLIEEFLEEAGYPDLIEGVYDRPFALEEAVLLFPTSFARGLFIRGCVRMIQADHQVSDEEREIAGSARTVYLSILITHIAAAAISFPFILLTFVHAWTNDFAKHKRLAKKVFPIWLFVAVTGPICYYMLKPFYPWEAAKVELIFEESP